MTQVSPSEYRQRERAHKKWLELQQANEPEPAVVKKKAGK